MKPIWKWRRALGVGRMDSEGSHRLILAASQAGADALKLNGMPDHVCDRMSERAKRLNLLALPKPSRRDRTGRRPICLAARDGVVTVIKPGPEFKVLATNKIGDEIAASPAISQGRIYLRGFQAL